jgi:hypothetical protein
VSLDPTHADQFVAIRNSGTWAGSIDDSNAEALESFATHYFTRPKSKSNSETNSNPFSSGSQSKASQGAQSPPKNAPPKRAMPEAALQAHYEEWATRTATVFAAALAARGGPAPKKLEVRDPGQQRSDTPQSFDKEPVLQSALNTPSPQLLTEFPYLPTALTTCILPLCASQKAHKDSLRACRHDVEKLLRASGLYSYEWLRTERLRWHPDRFGRLCDEEWREEGRRLAEEMWKIIDALMEMEKKDKNMGR